MSVELDANINIGNLTSATYKDVWYIYYRPQIQILMSGSSDNHVAALLLMIACMDRVYTLACPDKSGQKGGYTQDMLKYFFPKPEDENDDEYDRRMKSLADDLVNALKHDTFVRENVILSDAAQLLTEVAVKDQVIGVQVIEVVVKGLRRIAVTSEDNGKLTIAATAFWNCIRDTIDNFYSQTTTRQT